MCSIARRLAISPSWRPPIPSATRKRARSGKQPTESWFDLRTRPMSDAADASIFMARKYLTDLANPRQPSAREPGFPAPASIEEGREEGQPLGDDRPRGGGDEGTPASDRDLDQIIAVLTVVLDMEIDGRAGRGAERRAEDH